MIVGEIAPLIDPLEEIDNNGVPAEFLTSKAQAV
jgi:hypothetical protein